MVADELKTYQIGEKHYVSIRDAVYWRHIAPDTLLDQIALGKLSVERIESRQFIELDTLKAYAGNRKLKTSGWGRVDEFLGRE